MKQFIAALIFLCVYSITTFAQVTKVNYEITFPEPETHYATVSIYLEPSKRTSSTIKMPVWTPGSYLIREYAKNIESFSARTTSGKILVANKVNKNTWKVTHPANEKVLVSYKIYLNELTVRNAHVDKSHAYLNPAAVFAWVEEEKKGPFTLEVKLHPDWKKITTALNSIEGKSNKFLVPDLDTFYDSPLEIGNQEVFTFKASGIEHEVAMYGYGNYDKAQLSADMAKICEASHKIFGGEHPCKRYSFIVHNLPNGGGGLEHKASTTLQTSMYGYANKARYEGFLGLVAHEYFHLWNVKRLRPKALGPFDYENENYTTSLWIAEGFTAYYDDYILLKAGITTPERYLEVAASNLNTVVNTPGAAIQSVAEASLDAWIKFYRPNENSSNSTISYYTKGGVLAMMLDLEIRQATKGQKSLDDVMAMMYKEFYLKKDVGYTEEEFRKGVETVAGKSFEAFWNDYVFGLRKIDAKDLFAKAGITLNNKRENSKIPYLGLSVSGTNIQKIDRDSPAWNTELSVGDELLAINNMKFTGDFDSFLSRTNVGDEFTLTVVKSGALKEIKVKTARNPYASFELSLNKKASAEEKQIGEGWLNISK